jgi:hypothetical protein
VCYQFLQKSAVFRASLIGALSCRPRNKNRQHADHGDEIGSSVGALTAAALRKIFGAHGFFHYTGRHMMRQLQRAASIRMRANIQRLKISPRARAFHFPTRAAAARFHRRWSIPPPAPL